MANSYSVVGSVMVFYYVCGFFRSVNVRLKLGIRNDTIKIKIFESRQVLVM